MDRFFARTKLGGQAHADVVTDVSVRRSLVIGEQPGFCRAGSDGLPTEEETSVSPPEEDY